MPIMKRRQDLVTRWPQGNRQDASAVPGDRTTKPAEMPSIMQPSMQPNKPLGNQTPTMRESVQSGPAPTIRGFVPGDPEPVASSVAEAPAAVPGQPPATTTSERTHAIIGQDSPLMRQAATRGRQYAHQRGLLNSSLAAGSAQGAVLDRSIELGRADVEGEFKKFYAGLDKAKFESDANYRNRALDQEKQLQERRIQLDERVADSSIGIEEERLAFDRDRFASDAGYRDRVLAQEAQLSQNRLDFDVTRFRSDEVYRREVLAQEKELTRERLTFDKDRFRDDSEYRDRVLSQEADLSNKRLDFDKDRFRSDHEYRQNVLAQDLDIQTRRLDLTQEENEFRRSFDEYRFESDEAYRADVLAQEKHFGDRRADLDIEQLGLQRDEMSQNAYQGIRNTMAQLYNTYQAAIAAIMSVPNMSKVDRNLALQAASDNYDEARKEAGVFSGPSVPITWTSEGGFTPPGGGNTGGGPPGPPGTGGRTDFDNHWNAPSPPSHVTVKQGKSWDPARGRTTWTDPKYAPDDNGVNGATCRIDGSWVTYDPGAQTWGCPGDAGFTPHYPPDEDPPDDPTPPGEGGPIPENPTTTPDPHPRPHPPPDTPEPTEEELPGGGG